MHISPQTVLYLTAAAAALRMLYEYLHRRQHKLAAFLTGTFSGIAALLFCRFCGGPFGNLPPLTLCDLAIAAVAGIPGVILLAVMHLLHI